ncbi:signal peptidase I [Listeria seeligeri]|uniref:signal peptidase I n=1 Tax=Listeria seeligeri TaxID=1640 RepID=UPI0018882722|nr:signal peptidase I [Listeria seeligeri]MBF2528403.1 signal peptidase I [Listeria seeligeri]
MTKRVTFIGPNFMEYVSKETSLKMSFLERLWILCKQLDSEKKCNDLIQQLKLIEEQNSPQNKNEQLALFVRLMTKALPSLLALDTNERLLLFKKIVCQSMQEQVVQVEKELCERLGGYLANNDYIFSYSFDLFIESVVQANHELIVYSDRQSFLQESDVVSIPILYKFYGTLTQFETIALTREEKKERTINLRMAISKMTKLDDVTISLIGFEEDDNELKEIMNELAVKNRIEKINFVKIVNDNEESVKPYSVDYRTGMAVNVIATNLKNYIFEQKGIDSKKDIPLLGAEEALLPRNGENIEEHINSQSSRRYRNSAKKNQSQKKGLTIPYKALLTILGCLFCVVSFNFFFSLATIKGESMAPNFSSSDYIVLNKQYSKVNRFDVIAFKSPDEPGQEYIKRVIGLPGDVIEYIDDQLFINGNVVEESYLDREKKKLGEDEIFTKDFSLDDLAGVKEVPKNKLFVLGDNRLYSRDSRNFGFIDVKDIKGDVKFKIWPMK